MNLDALRRFLSCGLLPARLLLGALVGAVLLCASSTLLVAQSGPAPAATEQAAQQPAPVSTPQAMPSNAVSPAAAAGAAAGVDETASVMSSNVRIGPGDLVEITVFGAPDLSGRFRVTDEGNVDLPVTGQVHVENLDPESAARTVEQRLRQADIVKNPGVVVFILEYASQGVTLIGDVKAPGVYPLLGNRRLMDVLASAGGLAVTAGKDIRIQHRADFDHPEVISIDNVTVKPTRNPVIQSGDTITVPRSGVVYVLGDVGHPGGFLVENNNRLDMLKLLALAGGPNRSAGLNKTRLIRTTASGKVEYDIELKKVIEGRSQSLMLQDSDILYVPASDRKYLTYRSIEAAIQVGTGVLLYRNF